jgi:hypothetical protein
MFLKRIFRSVADHKSLAFKVAVLFEVFAITVIQILISSLDAKGAGPIPDLRFGYSRDELMQLFETWGEDGRNHYLRVETVDLFCYIPAYVVFGGGMLWKALQLAGWSEWWIYLVPVMALADYVETLSQTYNCITFPKGFNEYVFLLGTTANKIKWVSVGFMVMVMVIISAFFLKKQTSLKGKRH